MNNEFLTPTDRMFNEIFEIDFGQLQLFNVQGRLGPQSSASITVLGCASGGTSNWRLHALEINLKFPWTLLHLHHTQLRLPFRRLFLIFVHFTFNF